MNPEINYFVRINRILTTALAGLIATAVSIGIYFGLAVLVNIKISELENINFLLFIVLNLSLFFANLTFQGLNNYFYKLLERETYIDLGNKFLKNTAMGVLTSILTMILGFILYSQTNLAGLLGLALQLSLNLSIGVIIRENDKLLQTSHLYGLVTGVVFSLMALSIASKQNLGLGIIVGLIGLMIVPTVASCFEMLGYFTKNLVSKKEEVSDETPSNSSTESTFSN